MDIPFIKKIIYKYIDNYDYSDIIDGKVIFYDVKLLQNDDIPFHYVEKIIVEQKDNKIYLNFETSGFESVKIIEE